MEKLLNQLLSSIGIWGVLALVAVIGFGLGAIASLMFGRGSASPPPDVPPSPPPRPAEPPPAAASKEKRRNPRRVGRSVEVFVADPTSLAEPCKGVVLDRSVGGLGLLVGDEYAPGSKLHVLPASASKLTPWVEVEVKSCRKSGDDWEIGVQFIQPPPYATMVLFG